MRKGFNENSSLDSHVEASSNASSLEWLIGGILLTGGHQARHFILSELDLLATEGSKGKICDLELGSWCRHVCGVTRGLMRCSLCCGVGFVEGFKRTSTVQRREN